VNVKISDLCETCVEKHNTLVNSNEGDVLVDEEEKNASQIESENEINQLNDSENETFMKIKNLELELARVKLELVDAQCKNQELDHTIKNLKNGESPTSSSSILNNANIKNIDQLGAMSSSTSSLNQYASNSTNMASSPNQIATNLNGSNNSINNNANGNNWLSKTFTQFKEATNQVVQKAQKVNKTMSTDTNNN
jgi:hypothetical protein